MTKIEEYVLDNTQEIFDIIKDLCNLPAPSHFEHKRAEYCKNWLEKAGCRGVYIDDALNVVFPLNCEDSEEIKKLLYRNGYKI